MSRSRGSGVLNTTVRLVGDEGSVHCFAVSWNSEPDAAGRVTEIEVLARRSAIASTIAMLGTH